MKKFFASIFVLLFTAFSLAGCSGVGSKSGSHSIIYFAAAVLSLLLLIACCFLVRKKKVWFVVLFSSVLMVNIGYTLLSVSTCLEMALWANRVAYLGSVFLPLSMLMIILNVTGTHYPKWLHGALGIFSLLIFLIAASPGFSDVYYKEVSFAVVEGVATLVKVYGVLHPLYLIYLLGYFATMAAVIIRAQIKKTLNNPAHSAVLIIAVFVNIGVWLIEQLSQIDFEMLSLSYIISELFLLGIHLVMTEYQRMSNLVNQAQGLNSPSDKDYETPQGLPVSAESAQLFIAGLDTLTPTEKEIYNSHIARLTSKEIMERLNIKETTLKYHNRNLYGKLGVSCRRELLETHKYLQNLKKGCDKN